MTPVDWTHLLTDATYVRRIYSRHPDLSKVSVHEVVLDRNGSVLKLRFDVADYPDRPPEKWMLNQFNRAQFTLHVVEVSSVEIHGWHHEILGALLVSNADGGVHVLFSNGKVKIECYGAFLVLDKITGYSEW